MILLVQTVWLMMHYGKHQWGHQKLVISLTFLSSSASWDVHLRIIMKSIKVWDVVAYALSFVYCHTFLFISIFFYFFCLIIWIKNNKNNLDSYIIYIYLYIFYFILPFAFTRMFCLCWWSYYSLHLDLSNLWGLRFMTVSVGHVYRQWFGECVLWTHHDEQCQQCGDLVDAVWTKSHLFKALALEELIVCFHALLKGNSKFSVSLSFFVKKLIYMFLKPNICCATVWRFYLTV